MTKPQKGEFIALVGGDINPIYKYIPLEIVGLQYVPDLVAVKPINSNNVMPLNLEEVEYEVLYEDYVNGFRQKGNKRETLNPPQYAFGFLPDDEQF